MNIQTHFTQVNSFSTNLNENKQTERKREKSRGGPAATSTFILNLPKAGWLKTACIIIRINGEQRCHVNRQDRRVNDYLLVIIVIIITIITISAVVGKGRYLKRC